MVISYFRKCSLFSTNTFLCHHINIVHNYYLFKQGFIVAYHNLILIGIDFTNIHIFILQFQTFSLSDCIKNNSFMFSNNFSIHCHNISRYCPFSCFFVYKICIFSIGNKAHILTVFFMCNRNSYSFSNLSHFIFFIAAKRHNCMF